MWLVHWFPFFFPKRAEAIRLELKNVFQKRWIEVLNKLCLEELPPPQLKVVPQLETSHQKGVITISLSSICKRNVQLCRTIDHEMAHYIQYVRNSTLKEVKLPLIPIPSGLYWIVKRKMNKALAEKAFREGFATYVASITSGALNPKVEKAIKTIQSGKKWKILLQTESISYALGYLTYCAIAKIQSEKQAIHLGLSEDSSKWVSEGRAASVNFI